MTPRWIALLAMCSAASCRRPPQPGDPLPGLSAAERAQFDSGRAVFDSTFTPQVGLGPLFNASGCRECHEDPVTGANGDEVEHHATVFHPERAGAMCDELADKGGPVFQDSVTPALHAALGIDREPRPPSPTVVAERTTPDILGFGLLDAVPDSVILSYADLDDRNRAAIYSRPNRFFDGRLGRFGRKASVPTLREFNDGALSAEMGITSPAVPNEETVGGRPLPAGTDPAPDPELSPQATDPLGAVGRLLRPPAAQRLTSEARPGGAAVAR